MSGKGHHGACGGTKGRKAPHTHPLPGLPPYLLATSMLSVIMSLFKIMLRMSCCARRTQVQPAVLRCAVLVSHTEDDSCHFVAILHGC